MRMLLKVQVPVEAGNQAIKNDLIPGAIEGMVEQLSAEAAYFFAEDGLRTALIVFDLQELSQIPGVVEPLFMGASAALDLVPVMNLEELKAGLQQVKQNL